MRKKENIIWQYKHGKWLDYDTDASVQVELAYQDWLGNKSVDVRAVKSGSFQYQVDFNQMKQTNIQHPNHTMREIRRHVAA